MPMKTDPKADSPTADLNAYHQARNKRMIKKASRQPSMSSEAFIEQTRRLAQSSNRKVLTSGD